MYEFYCHKCNTIFTFFSKTVNTDKIPQCPKCEENTMRRMVSPFAITGRKDSPENDDAHFPVDENTMGNAFESLAADIENCNEDDPKQAAQLMRKFSEMTGLKLGDKMEDAVSRMEAGEDPDEMENEIGEIDEEDLFKIQEHGGKVASKLKSCAPKRDDTLYEM